MKRTAYYSHQTFLPLVVLLAAVLAACGIAPAQSVAVDPYPPPVVARAPTTVQYEYEVRYADEDLADEDYEDADYDDYEDTDPSAVVIFRTQLEPHGVWIEDLNYGLVWVPDASVVGSDFVPYSSAGYWAYTDSGDYVWVSDYSWGEVVFHYGRWVWISGVGWAWIPGRKYAPAWVVWRVPEPGYYYVGWAPMPPTFYWYGGVAVSLWIVPPPVYVYCESRYVFVRHEHHHRLSGPRAAQAERYTRPYTPAKPTSNRTAARPSPGPSPAEAGIPNSAMPKQRLSSRDLIRQRMDARLPNDKPLPSGQLKDSKLGSHRPQIDRPVRIPTRLDTAASDKAGSDEAGSPAPRFAGSGARELTQEHRVGSRSATDSAAVSNPALRAHELRDMQQRPSAMRPERVNPPRNSTIVPDRPLASSAFESRTQPQSRPSSTQVMRPESSSRWNQDNQGLRWNRPEPRPAPSVRRNDSQPLNRHVYEPKSLPETTEPQKTNRPLLNQSARSTTSSTSSGAYQRQSSTRSPWQSAPASRSQFRAPSFQQRGMGTPTPATNSWQNNNGPLRARSTTPSHGGRVMPSRPSSSSSSGRFRR